MAGNSGSADYDAYFKVLMVGDSGTGKSCLLARVIHNRFSEDTKMTIGVDMGILTLDIEGKVIKSQIWDTAGQERFRAVTPAFYKGAHGVLLVYDVTRHETFENLPKWLSEVRQYAPQAAVIVCGNKSDLQHIRTVTEAEAKAYCSQQSLYFIETSAKTADNVVQAFTILLDELYKSSAKSLATGQDSKAALPEDTIRITPEAVPQKPKSSCCSRS